MNTINDSKENVPLKSLSQEEFYELPENKKERSCTASECIFTRWSKPTSVHELMFVSKDVLLIRVEKTLIFHNVGTRKEEIIVVAGGNESTPAGGDSLPLDGIGCVDCCSSMDLLALAEQPPVAKVVICRYSDRKVLATLIGEWEPLGEFEKKRLDDFVVTIGLQSDSEIMTHECNSATYKSILFLRLEYLIGLRDYPAFDLIVWAWRIQEKVFVVNTGFIQPNQSLNLSATGRVVYLSQTERDVMCRLQLWTMFTSCKTVYAKKTLVELPSDVDVRSGCWTPSGCFVFCDSSMNVYRTQPSTPRPEMCVEYTENDCETRALMCSTRHGFMLYTTNRLTCFKDSKGVFTKNWTIDVNHTLQSMVAGENDVYAWSNEGILLELTHKKEQILKVYGTSIKYFTFIKPTDETLATINEKNVLQVWDVTTGELKCEKKLNGIATNVFSNPFYFYVAISFKNGKVELLKTDPKINDLENIAKIVLCDDELSLVKFFSDGNECIVTSFPTGRFYRINIKLGHMCSVMKEYHLEKQLIDIEIFDSKTSSFLAVLNKNQETADIVGNNILIFDTNFNIVFQLKNTQFHYTSVFKWISFGMPNIINVAFTAKRSKRIHLMKIDISQAKFLELETIPLDHNMRKVSVGKYHCVTSGYDGMYNLYGFDDDGNWKNIVTVNCSHWQTGGLLDAQVDVKARNILTLSHRGNFMCTSIKETCDHNKRFQQTEDIGMPTVINYMKTKGIGFENGPETPKRMTWIMINKENELNASKVTYSEQKNRIIEEFEKIKEELLTLFEKNVNGPEDLKIDIDEFDLNVDYKLKFREKCKIERHEYKSKILGDINKFKMETENILKEHWESLFVKPKSIYCLKKSYKVDNYPISITDQEVIVKANKIIEKRSSFKDNEVNASGVHTSFSKDYLEMLDDESKLEESENRQSNDKLLLGSISHRFVDTIKQFNSQYDYYKSEMANDEIILLHFMINKLKHRFNKLFDDLFVEKQNHLDILKKYNDRLRAIEIEFRLACKIERTEPAPIDYKWNQYEKTEQLIYVEDDEVPVKPYNSVSSKQLTLTDTSIAKSEQSRQLFAFDNFRQWSLNNMMDGVLEKRWEDELKKEVPKPPCMLKKSIDQYTEEDFESVKEYEKLVVIRTDERTKYKKILEDERTKIIQRIKENLEEVDNNVFKLFQIKLKYNSAIDQEYLKINRLSKMLSESDQRKQQIKRHRETISNIEQIITETTKKIAKTETTYNSLLNTIETLKHKNSVLNKCFKSEFPSKLIYEQALIAYNRRPKVQGITNYSSLLGYQFVNTIMDPIDDKLELLHPEFVKYLDILRVYDDYKYVDDYKLNMDKETWNKVCNFRRLKIETEFKISTCQKDAIDKANLLDNLMHIKEDEEAIIEKLKMSINKLENQNLLYEDDPEIQIVLEQGNAEIKLTGHFTDFDNTVLIPKNVIDEVNAEIKEMGKIKIDVLSNLLKFKRKCRLLTWEHAILKNHKITLYKYRFDVITNMKVTENMLHYLKFKTKGIDIAKLAQQKVEKELAAIQITYSKDKEVLRQRLDELLDKIRSVKKENKKIDKNIDQMDFYLSELKKKINYNLTNKLQLVNDSRMKMIVKRAQMITNLQELHKTVYILQTELELLLLKTYPTLYTNSQSTSIRK